MRYYAIFEKTETGGFWVRFRDVPEAVTQGDTLEEAQELAADALLTAMDFYIEDRRAVPLPSAPQDGEIAVELTASSWVKVLLLNAVIEAGISNAELGRRLGMTPSTVQRLFEIQHTSKLDTLAAALKAVGKSLTINLE